MSLVWQDWDETMKWQTDSEYVPSDAELTAHIILACECWRQSQQYYAALRG